MSNNNTQSSINSILASVGGPDSNNLEIQDPNSQDPNAKLKGSAAAKMVVAKSSLGKQSLSFGTRNFITELEGSVTQGTGTSESDHQDTSNFPFDPTRGGQSEVRVVTIKENLSTEEAKIFDEKIKELKDKGILTNHAVPFKANFPTTNVSLTGTGARGTERYASAPNFNFASYNGQTVLPCASLIELLLILDSKIKLRGSFDLDRSANNVAVLISGGKAMAEGARLNDHTTGRGIDIGFIGPSDTEEYSTWNKNLDVNRKAFTLLLDTLMSLEDSFLPDLIVFDDRLADEFGMTREGYEIDNKEENLNGILQKKYAKLRKIDFHPDPGHTNHFHIAFSPQRAGTYQDYYETTTSSGTDSGASTGVAAGASGSIGELYANFINSAEKIKNTNALYKGLIDYVGLRPESAALFMAIAERESHYGPGSFNGNLNTGDYSIGIWQTNFLRSSSFPRKSSGNTSWHSGWTGKKEI
jgi:hypothetical protein